MKKEISALNLATQYYFLGVFISGWIFWFLLQFITTHLSQSLAVILPLIEVPLSVYVGIRLTSSYIEKGYSVSDSKKVILITCLYYLVLNVILLTPITWFGDTIDAGVSTHAMLDTISTVGANIIGLFILYVTLKSRVKQPQQPQAN